MWLSLPPPPPQVWHKWALANYEMAELRRARAAARDKTLRNSGSRDNLVSVAAHGGGGGLGERQSSVRFADGADGGLATPASRGSGSAATPMSDYGHAVDVGESQPPGGAAAARRATSFGEAALRGGGGDPLGAADADGGHLMHEIAAVRGFARAIALSRESGAPSAASAETLQDTLRLLRLWCVRLSAPIAPRGGPAREITVRTRRNRERAEISSAPRDHSRNGERWQAPFRRFFAPRARDDDDDDGDDARVSRVGSSTARGSLSTSRARSRSSSSASGRGSRCCRS